MSRRTRTMDVFDRLDELAEAELAEVADVTEVANAADEADEEQAKTPRDGDEDSQSTKKAGRQRLPLVLVAAALVVAVVAAAFLGWRLKQAEDTEAAGRAALEAARNFAVALTTLDVADIDRTYQQVLDGATGQFKDEYSQGSAQLRQVLVDNEAAGRGIVVDAALKSVTENRVEVLLFVDQSVTNSLNPSPRIDRNRVQMTMNLVDGHWLASEVELV